MSVWIASVERSWNVWEKSFHLTVNLGICALNLSKQKSSVCWYSPSVRPLYLRLLVSGRYSVFVSSSYRFSKHSKRSFCVPCQLMDDYTSFLRTVCRLTKNCLTKAYSKMNFRFWGNSFQVGPLGMQSLYFIEFVKTQINNKLFLPQTIFFVEI